MLKQVKIDIGEIKAELLPLLRKGETARVWVPTTRGMVDAAVYQIEVVDVLAPPARGSADRASGSRG